MVEAGAIAEVAPRLAPRLQLTTGAPVSVLTMAREAAVGGRAGAAVQTG